MPDARLAKTVHGRTFLLGGQCLCSVRKPVFVFHCFFLEANVFTNDGKQRHMDYSFLFCHIPGIQ